MPVVRGGDVRLRFDGTFEFHGDRPVHGNDVIEVFSALEPPGGGRVWWKIFAANAVFRSNRYDFDRVTSALGFEYQSNLYYAAKNDPLIDWLLESQLYHVISFSVFNDTRKHFWLAKYDCPRLDDVAKKLIAHCWEHPNPSRNKLKELAS